MDSVIQFEGTIYENGYGLLAQKVMRDKSLKGQSKLIYAYMCSFASVGKNGDRLAFPSVSLQCAELNMSEDTYYKWRKPLIEKGYIKITKQRQEGAKFDNNVYSIVAIPVPLEIEKTADKKDNKPYPKKTGTEKPYPKKPSTENPSTENPGTIINSSTIINFNKREEEEENHLSELISLFSNCIAPANKIIENKLISWMELLPSEVIKIEIENAALYGAKSWQYVEKLLIEDKQKNLRTAADVNNKVVEYKSRKGKSKVNNKKPIRTEMLPEWFVANNTENIVENVNNEDAEAKKRAIAEKLKAFNSK